ncbi:MAG: HlyD family efflux transporter periplasmic adaptor subunit [Candidatus Paceibacterota bacterium]|jgi:multidrug efflux pump subunit AcrA (membrane-fusion protein)
MKKILENIKKFFKKIDFRKTKGFVLKHKIISAVIIIVLIYSGYLLFSKVFTKTKTVEYTFGKVQKGDLVVSISGSGQVSTLSKVSIKPNTTGQTQTLGQITSVKVKNGDYVKAGQIVAILDGKNALQTLNQAKASVTSAQASYDKLVKGMTDSEALSVNNTLTQAQTSLDNAKQNILIKLKSAYTTASNSIYLSTDSFFENNPVSSSPSFKIDGVSFLNYQLENNINIGRYDIGIMLNTWRGNIRNQTIGDDLVASINNAISNLNMMRNYFDDMTILFASYSTASNSSGQSSINTNKSTASSARGSIDSLISDLVSTLQSYNNTVFSLQQAKDNLALKLEPASEDDLAVQKASLDNAKANLANAEEAYSSRIITAPFDGQIGGLSAEVGQQVSSSDSLATLITSEKVINVTLNEVDAAKVSGGNIVKISFDSLPGLSLTGVVGYIDPLGTVSQGVVSYAVQIKMDKQDEQVKAGMTASVSIITTQHSGTLIIPTSAITTIGGKKFVLIADVSSSTKEFQSSTTKNFSSSTKGTSSRQFGNYQASGTKVFQNLSNIQYPVINVEITTGISNNTSTEVLSGLYEGQLIVTKKTTVSSTSIKTSASSATTNTRGGFGGPGALGGM